MDGTRRKRKWPQLYEYLRDGVIVHVMAPDPRIRAASDRARNAAFLESARDDSYGAWQSFHRSELAMARW